MKFAEFLTEGEVVKFQKKETPDLKKLYEILLSLPLPAIFKVC